MRITVYNSPGGHLVLTRACLRPCQDLQVLYGPLEPLLEFDSAEIAGPAPWAPLRADPDPRAYVVVRPGASADLLRRLARRADGEESRAP